MRIRLFTAIVAGLAVGMSGRAMLQEEQSRGARFVSIFERYCVPFAKARSVPDPSDLQSLPGSGQTAMWADPNDLIFLSVGPRNCTVSDEFSAIPSEEHEKIDRAVVKLVADRFPEMTRYEPEGGSSVKYDAWTDHPDQLEAKTAIMLFRAVGDTGAPETRLMVNFGPD